MSADRWFGPGVAQAIHTGMPSGDHLPRTALAVLLGVPRHLPSHLERLQAGASAMGRTVDWLPGIEVEMTTWLNLAAPGMDAALRMVLHPDDALVSARLEALPTAPQPYRLIPMPHPLRDRQMETTLMHKGLSGPWSQAVLSSVRQVGADDALLLWADGTVAETAIASVGIEQGNVLTLPPQLGRVASLAERLDLPGWAESRGLRIDIGRFPLPGPGEGQVWCMNALRGIWSATLL